MPSTFVDQLVMTGTDGRTGYYAS